MSTATLPSSVLVPQPPGGLGAGAAMALAVHAALLAALTLGVDWRAHAPEPVAAELWASVPTAAAPPPAEPVAPAPAPAPAVAPEPAPAPAPAPAPPPAVKAPPPDIAVERERERERERTRRAEAERKADAERKVAAERAEQDRRQREAKAAEAKAAAEEKAAEERLARQREENLRRMLGQAGAVAGSTGSTGAAAQAAAPSAAYQGKVKAAILPNITYTGNAPPRAAAEVEVTLAPGGTIIARRLVKRSGHADWDEAVLRAIDKTATLPRDTDGRVPPLLLISFRPNE